MSPPLHDQVDELVQSVTPDGVTLHGALANPTCDSQLPLDAILCLHGTGGSFYSSGIFRRLSAQMTGLGVNVLRANMRGHDLVTYGIAHPELRRLGAAYEIVDHCRFDISAWLDVLSRRGFQSVGLVGHSMGAIKSVYSSAYEFNPLVRAVIAISPPSLSYARFQSSEKHDLFEEIMDRAHGFVDSGQPDELMEVGFPLPMLITASSYVDKYGPDERYDVLKHISKLRIPSFFSFGTKELGGVAFRDLPTQIDQLSGSESRSVRTIEGADHFYSVGCDDLINEIVIWLKSLTV